MEINRLEKQRAYLAGAIDRVADRGVGWRDNITPFLEGMNVVVFNPLNKSCDVGIEDNEVHNKKLNLRNEEKYEELSSVMGKIRRVDLRLVDISDFLIVNLDLNTHPCGTLEEIFRANEQKKPIIIHVEQGKKQAPDWLFGTMPHQMIFSNWDEVKHYLQHINSADKIEDYKRWFFFKH